jgi:LDH2 family malate/lactate/ureidoglycolate dehydrogenase
VTTILTDVGVMAVSLSQSMLRVWTTAPIAVGSPLRKHAPCVADLAESTRTN